jgi:hypothetical protein
MLSRVLIEDPLQALQEKYSGFSICRGSERYYLINKITFLSRIRIFLVFFFLTRDTLFERKNILFLPNEHTLFLPM